MHPVRLGHPVKRVRDALFAGCVLRVARFLRLGQSCTPSPSVLSYSIRKSPQTSPLCPHTLLHCDKASAVLDRGGAFAWRPHRGAFFLGPLPVQPPSRTVAVHSLEKMKSQITQQNRECTSSVPHPQPPWWISVFWLQQCSCNQLPRRHHGERRLN